MCRIAGIIDFYLPQNLNAITGMRDSMWHGGPDDAGTYREQSMPMAIAVRRLSLLDLSDLGHQPMLSEDGQVVLAYNGELYNFSTLRVELRGLGHHFKTGTDTEVVLAAYLQWGADAFSRFNGMFGLCLWDKQKHELFLARDHAGMKPLYYFMDARKGQLYFASEVRAFKKVNPHWPEDPQWRIRFLAYGHMPEPHTTLKGVQALPAGHYLKLSLPHFDSSLHRWYQPAPAALITDAAAANALLHGTLTAALQRHLVADAPVGVFLSGGVDSSLLTVLAAKMRPPGTLHTVSLVFEEAGFSEKKYQDIIVEKAGTRHQAFNISQLVYESAMPEIMDAMDQPSNDGINSFFISQCAREAGLKAVLSGIGADELFGGYEVFKWRSSQQKLKRLPKWALAAAALSRDDRWKRVNYLQYNTEAAEYLFYRGFFIPGQIARLLDMDVKEVEQVLMAGEAAPVKEKHADHSTYISGQQQRYYLRNQLLRDADAMSMWHGVEVRIPFLDREVVELCNRVSPKIRFAVPGTKTWLIDTFKAELPAEIWQRKKMGFTFPFAHWTRSANIAGAADYRLNRVQQQFRKGHIKWSRYWTYLVSTGQKITFKPPDRKILFLSLTTFSATGGIEKFNSSFSKALNELALQNNWQVSHFSVYDDRPDTRYFPEMGFLGFRENKLGFSLRVLQQARHYDLIIAGHINLGPLLWLAGKLFSIRYWCMAHGIEMWQPLSFLKRSMLRHCERVLSVSRFTAETLTRVQGVAPGRIAVFPNTVDPFFAENPEADPLAFRRVLEISPLNQVLLTVARLSSTEKYKGYDEVLQALPAVKARFPMVRYVLAGKADAAEAARIRGIIERLGLKNEVILTGFVEEETLPLLYQMANLFVMPSRKEGFGIVFIEAAWCGLPLIAGNQDGSSEALLDGRLGNLVTPGDINELAAAISALLSFPYSTQQKALTRQMAGDHFGFSAFKTRLSQLLEPAV